MKRILLTAMLAGIAIGSHGSNNPVTAQEIGERIPQVGERLPRFNDESGWSMGWGLGGTRPRSGWITFYEHGVEQSLICDKEEIVFNTYGYDKKLSFVDNITVTKDGRKIQTPDGYTDQVRIGPTKISSEEGPYSLLVEDVPYCLRNGNKVEDKTTSFDGIESY